MAVRWRDKKHATGEKKIQTEYNTQAGQKKQTFGQQKNGIRDKKNSIVDRRHRGFTRQPENSKRAHLRPRRFKNTKIPRKDPPKEGRNNDNCGGRGDKKRAVWRRRGPGEGAWKNQTPTVQAKLPLVQREGENENQTHSGSLWCPLLPAGARGRFGLKGGLNPTPL